MPIVDVIFASLPKPIITFYHYSTHIEMTLWRHSGVQKAGCRSAPTFSTKTLLSSNKLQIEVSESSSVLHGFSIKLGAILTKPDTLSDITNDF